MAFTISLTNGAATSSATSAKTVAEIANFNRLVTLDKISPPPEGLTAAALNQFYLDAVKDEIVRHLRQEAARNRLGELRAAANIEAQATADTTL